ncbi:hypothetical protein NDU88_003793 [Pleurodeles waltl]|uniref:Uncharacterized protein n=1 Tax=Pleurodeles waltl TaxID=8319 RepID=A0AAV7NJ81_PLEWA|nr:hypothetical protein NDU88_003793 [Pleurodeles waltl]
MAERRAQSAKAAAELFDGSGHGMDSNRSNNICLRTITNIIRELEKACISELKKWWEMTSLTKYIESGRVPRGLRILILPTLGDINLNLLEEWSIQTSECSFKLMGTLITEEQQCMEEQIKQIEELMKELEKLSKQKEVKQLLGKMEEQIAKQEEEIKTQKAHKFNRDKLDYEPFRIYTFARKYETLRIKENMNNGGEMAANYSNTDVSSDPGSSADEAPPNKLDFRRVNATHANGHTATGQKQRTRRGKGRNIKHKDWIHYLS